MAMNATIRPKVYILTAKFYEQLPTGSHLASAICVTIIVSTGFVPYRFCPQWLDLCKIHLRYRQRLFREELFYG